MLSGIDNSNCDISICMDSDLQHPAEMIPEMLLKYKDNNDIILMNRVKRHDNGFLKNFLSNIFYKFLSNLSSYNFEKNASDFFLIT